MLIKVSTDLLWSLYFHFMRVIYAEFFRDEDVQKYSLTVCELLCIFDKFFCSKFLIICCGCVCVWFMLLFILFKRMHIVKDWYWYSIKLELIILVNLFRSLEICHFAITSFLTWIIFTDVIEWSYIWSNMSFSA